MKTKKNKKGFTLVELITAVVIIGILIGILMPALNMARNFAKNTKQKVQINSIEAGINMYKNDFGEYPPSHGNTTATPPLADPTYCGAQTLTEAMFGYDLMGMHPASAFRFDGKDSSDGDLYATVSFTNPPDDNLKKRKSFYLDRTNLGVFLAHDVYNTALGTLVDRYVICDTFNTVNRNIAVAGGGTRVFAVGTPILYFRANTANLDIDDTSTYSKNIYDYDDNRLLIGIGTVKDNTAHDSFNINGEFCNFIKDPIASITNRTRPVRPDSFLLISAGQDGLYGTQDDICNFDPNS